MVRDSNMIIDKLIIAFIVFGVEMCWILGDYVYDLKRGRDEGFWDVQGTMYYISICSFISVIIIMFWSTYVTGSDRYENVKEYEIQSHMEKRGDHFVTDMEGETRKVLDGDKSCDRIKYKYTEEKQKVVIKQNEYKGIYGCKEVTIYTND